MKAQTNPIQTWEMIMEALGKKSESQMKTHYKAIQPKTDEEKKKWADKYAMAGKGQVDDPAKQAAGKRKGGGWNDQVKKPDWNSSGSGGDGRGGGGKKGSESNVSPTSSWRL
jgi:hypothetical protein